MTKKIGFACKWIDRPDQVNGIKAKDDCKKYNTGTTTVAWLNRQSKDVAEKKLWDLLKNNIESTRLLVERVGKLNEKLRMVRLSSDILPVYTEPSWSYFYRDNTVRQYLERHFLTIGDIARRDNIRLSFHPGQYTVLASDNPEIVNRSIEEFEYHVDMARWMGYGKKFQDFKINVHIAGRAGPQGIRNVFSRLSPEARNTITIENEEIKYGLADCLELADILPIVLDVHHFWVREGEYIQPEDPLVYKVLESWRGERPVLHYSISREDVLVGHDPGGAPFMESILRRGITKQKLRAHSDFFWNHTVNRYVLRFADQFDIMCESKGKNIASFALFEFAETNGLI